MLRFDRRQFRQEMLASRLELIRSLLETDRALRRTLAHAPTPRMMVARVSASDRGHVGSWEG
jgi:hypothetical protein